MKQGRPVIGKPKIIDIKVRIDSDTNDKLLQYCTDTGQKRAEVIRIAVENFLKTKRQNRG